jgi:transcriptional regulator with XRE-family HTH domain
MAEKKISKTELAARMGVVPGLVTRLLSGRNNFEISTMVRMARAVDCKFRPHLEPVGAKTVWFHVLRSDSVEMEPETEDCGWGLQRFESLPSVQILKYEALAATA